jgi:predicted house-cleaning noncanonical NTP pyrophosphatase (MazG superfamily)
MYNKIYIIGPVGSGKTTLSKKLVRDNIPNIIEKNGETPVIRILEDDEYKKELYKKLLEETNEVIQSETQEEMQEELADVIEVLRSIAELNNKKLEDMIEIANEKKQKRGGFQKRIYLEKKYTKED